MTDSKKTAGNKTSYAAPMVDHLLDIVDFLSRQHRAFGVTELSRELKISTNAVFRLMRRLMERGYADFDPESKGYRLGSKFYTLGMRLGDQFDLPKRIRPFLEQLCLEVGETCQAHVPDDRCMVALEVVSPKADFFLHVTPGSRLYYHPNAFGKAVLAFLSPAEICRRLPAQLPELTPNTITDRNVLIDSLETTRETGLAYDWGEYTRGVYCIGAPVFNVHNRPIAGVGMTGLDVRYVKEECRGQKLAVLRAASYIAADVGYGGDRYEKWIERLNQRKARV